METNCFNALMMAAKRGSWTTPSSSDICLYIPVRNLTNVISAARSFHWILTWRLTCAFTRGKNHSLALTQGAINDLIRSLTCTLTRPPTTLMILTMSTWGWARCNQVITLFRSTNRWLLRVVAWYSLNDLVSTGSSKTKTMRIAWR